ncbi:head-tail connector protein [Aquamicrobium soli]|uniref:Head-tail connector protein n=1 Tax=Aquamicrobium soli TaxID=1811518 RepID=A0ABV7KEE7_9HYPH
MWQTPTETVAPADEPVTLDETKHQCRIDFDDDNDYFSHLIAAARDHVEHYCAAKFAAVTVQAEATAWADMTELPVVGANSVSAISYVDTAGETQTLGDDVYELQGDSVVLRAGQAWPDIQAGSVITVAYKLSALACPSSVKHAMLLWLDDAYENRSVGAQESWTTLDALLCNHRYYA